MGDIHASSADPISSLQPRRHRSSVAPPANDVEAKEVQNARALQVLSRVKEKLTGKDGKPNEEQTVEDQVARLIQEATNLENLCQHYIGWCSFW
jgi:FKBP12-rapamycin complex-associated protein